MDPYSSSFVMLDNVLVFSFSLASFPANQSLLRIHLPQNHVEPHKWPHECYSPAEKLDE